LLCSALLLKGVSKAITPLFMLCQELVVQRWDHLPKMVLVLVVLLEWIPQEVVLSACY
jgi:hypothetical protein